MFLGLQPFFIRGRVCGILCARVAAAFEQKFFCSHLPKIRNSMHKFFQQGCSFSFVWGEWGGANDFLSDFWGGRPISEWICILLLELILAIFRQSWGVFWAWAPIEGNCRHPPKVVEAGLIPFKKVLAVGINPRISGRKRMLYPLSHSNCENEATRPKWGNNDFSSKSWQNSNLGVEQSQFQGINYNHR